ncbi:MAG: hypothetical protein NWE94_01875 [Candidatus Bathyarchaeota archaeon]|nr:hypothetical protein [Candidatus Bathyarchaeota archaeon]
MPQVKMKLEIRDKDQTFTTKATYDPDTHLAIAQRKFRQQFPTKYVVSPDDIVKHITTRGRIELKADVSVETRHSIRIAPNPDWKSMSDEQKIATEHKPPDVPDKSFKIDLHDLKTLYQELKNMLDYFTERSYWDSLIKKGKLSISTILILLTAGGGLFYLIRDIILPIFGAH